MLTSPALASASQLSISSTTRNHINKCEFVKVQNAKSHQQKQTAARKMQLTVSHQHPFIL
jgi:hypothetical protein